MLFGLNDKLDKLFVRNIYDNKNKTNESYHKSPTAIELDKYSPVISHDPVTAIKPHTEKKISAHLECLATPTNKTAHNTNSNPNIITVINQRINSY